MVKQVRLIFIFFFLLCSSIPFLFGNQSSDTLYQVKEELDVKVVMRDGIRLSTNIYRPDSPEKFPALLMRTPYGNGGTGNKEAHVYAQHGYAVVIQDTRGRFESEGIFDAMQAEALDGYDTQQWLGTQPWCNGKIGTFGGSYVGYTQWMPAQFQSPYLVTMFPMVTFADLHDMVYQGGALRLRLFTMWSFSMTAPYTADLIKLTKQLDSINFSLPLLEQDKLAGWRVSFMRDWMQHPEHDLYWDRTSVKNDGFTKIKASAYNLGGWFDICLDGTLKNFTAMTSSTINPEIRKKQKLLIGPWVHGMSKDGKVGDLDFGKESLIDLGALMMRWFDSQLKEIPNGIMDEDPVKIFVMGKNVWRTEKEWPLARTQYRKYFFYSKGKANTLNGDGSLNQILPGNEAPDKFIYDPGNPVSSIAGNVSFNPFTFGPCDQKTIENRNDVLVYSTPPLEKSIEVTGPVKVILYASSSAVNTDFIAKLVDVYPDNRAIRLCEGIIRASFRETNKVPSNIKPDSIYRYELDLLATSNTFIEGHRIRVEISSSNFPYFDRNLNTGQDFAKDSTYVKAEQTIYHNTTYPSHIVLPVIE